MIYLDMSKVRDIRKRGTFIPEILFFFYRNATNKVCCYAHPDAPLIEDYRAGDQICSECGLVVGDR